jgi:hypothetical protein
MEPATVRDSEDNPGRSTVGVLSALPKEAASAALAGTTISSEE